jgi:hypothetical protein
MNVQLINQNGYLQLEYESKYATGSIPVDSPQQLVDAIEEICGKGSYCFYYKNPKHPFGYTDRVISYNEYKNYTSLPKITYWQQGVKTQVIEQCRDVAMEVWGNIPEMSIGWLENMCKTYVD